MNEHQHIRKATNLLGQFLSEHRKQLIEQVLTNRTRYLTVVLEDIWQPQNASAVIRSCECFGVQDLHVIEKTNSFRPNPKVTQGSSKWLDIYRYTDKPDSTRLCLDTLRNHGYRLLAAGFTDAAVKLADIPLDQPLAVCIGAEEHGLSETALEHADMVVKIPMCGFTQSFNLSVSAALCMYELCNRIKTTRNDWRLSETMRDKIRLKWYMKSVRNPLALLREFGYGDMFSNTVLSSYG